MKHLNSILLPCALVMGSCSHVKTVTNTAKSTDIYGPGVLQYPIIVDLEVRETKVTGIGEGKTNENIEVIKQEAIANANKAANADVLVEPVFEFTYTGTTRVSATVTGYPANYKNFRHATAADLPMLQAGILQRPRTAEVTVQPARQKQNGGKGLLIGGIVVLMSILIYGLADQQGATQ